MIINTETNQNTLGKTKIVSEDYYNFFPINNSNQINTGHMKKLLENFYILLLYMISRYNKVLVLRFDLRYPLLKSENITIDPQKEHIHIFNTYLKKYLNRLSDKIHHNINCQYIWCREYGQDKNYPHYHYILILNGNAFKNGFDLVVTFINQLWNLSLGLNKYEKNHLSQFVGSTIIRFDKEDTCSRIEKIFQNYIGYISKTYSKYRNENGINLHGSSIRGIPHTDLDVIGYIDIFHKKLDRSPGSMEYFSRIKDELFNKNNTNFMDVRLNQYRENFK